MNRENVRFSRATGQPRAALILSKPLPSACRRGGRAYAGCGSGAVCGGVGNWDHGQAQSSDTKTSQQRSVAGNLRIVQCAFLGRSSSARAGGSSAAVQRAQVRRRAERSADRERNSQSCGEVVNRFHKSVQGGARFQEPALSEAEGYRSGPGKMRALAPD